jgi:hypothetical protein
MPNAFYHTFCLTLSHVLASSASAAQLGVPTAAPSAFRWTLRFRPPPILRKADRPALASRTAAVSNCVGARVQPDWLARIVAG